jgi:putative ABC transport system ATP-binding protein
MRENRRVSGAAVFLRADNLSRAVPGKRIVDGVTFQVAPGEFLAVVGPSGSGKTSLLRLLNRLDEPTGGTVWLEGRDYRGIPPRELRRRLGMVMQRPYLFPGTVADNVRFGPLQRGETLARSEVARLLESAGLGGYEERDVAELSGGEAQRVALARALANRPAALLLDEPTSALNEELKLQIEALIREVAMSRGLTCVLVTHDRAQAARMAASVLLLEAGRAAGYGAARELLHAE